jgi:hypothetical protein
MTYSIDDYFAPRPDVGRIREDRLTDLRCKTGASAVVPACYGLQVKESGID